MHAFIQGCTSAHPWNGMGVRGASILGTRVRALMHCALSAKGMCIRSSHPPLPTKPNLFHSYSRSSCYKTAVECSVAALVTQMVGP